MIRKRLLIVYFILFEFIICYEHIVVQLLIAYAINILLYNFIVYVNKINLLLLFFINPNSLIQSVLTILFSYLIGIHFQIIFVLIII